MFRGVVPPPCYHGGSSWDASGLDFGLRDGLVVSDVLDAPFPPSPQVLSALREHLGRLASECAIALVLLPTALVGATIRLALRLLGREPIALGPPAPKKEEQPAQ